MGDDVNLLVRIVAAAFSGTARDLLCKLPAHNRVQDSAVNYILVVEALSKGCSHGPLMSHSQVYSGN